MQLPDIYPTYFDLNLELISPHNQACIDLLQNKSYALVIVRASSHVALTAGLQLNDQEVEGGHRVVFDDQNQLYGCYVAPSTTGKHKITIFAKQRSAQDDSYEPAINLILNVQQRLALPISFSQAWKNFFTLGLDVVSPRDTHLITLNKGVDHANIELKAPKHVKLIEHLEDEQNKEIINGNRVYYDRKSDIWRCQFAPDRDGHFETVTLAKMGSDPGSYSAAISFKIEAKQIPSPPLSYPHTWPLFYELGLTIEASRNRANAIWPDNATYADVHLFCEIKYNKVKIENESLAQFNHEKNLW